MPSGDTRRPSHYFVATRYATQKRSSSKICPEMGSLIIFPPAKYRGESIEKSANGKRLALEARKLWFESTFFDLIKIILS